MNSNQYYMGMAYAHELMRTGTPGSCFLEYEALLFKWQKRHGLPDPFERAVFDTFRGQDLMGRFMEYACMPIHRLGPDLPA